MKNKFLIISILLFQMSFSQLWNYNFCSTLGSNVYGPMYSVTTANATNRTAVIYPASDLTSIAGQVLNSIYFDRTTAAGTLTGSPNLKIYIKEVSVPDWGSSAVDWATITTGATLVYDANPASITGNSAGWKEFEFLTNFTYSGTQNLAIFYEYSNTAANTTSIQWRYEYLSACIDTSNNNTTKYVNNTTGTLSASLTSTNFRRPVIGFDFLVSCNAPTEVVSSNLTINSIDFSWTAGNTGSIWEYAIVPQGSGLPTAGFITSTSSNINVTGLNPGTAYSFYLREVCDISDQSVWVGPINFTTLCVDVTEIIETFENYPTGVGNMPPCWNIGGTSSNVYITTGSVAPMSASNRLYINTSASNEAFAMLPPVSNLQANSHRLKFKAYATSANKILSVGYLPNPADVSSFTELQSISLPSTAASTAQEFTIIPTNIPVGVKVLAFRSNNASTTTIYIDDVKWEVNTQCPEPTNMAVQSVSNTNATIVWSGSSLTYDLEYGPIGFSLGNGTLISNIATSSTTITGLLANTNYQYYLRGNCSLENSAWTLPFTFKTQCDPVTAFLENFDSYPTTTGSMPDCWAVAGTSTLVSILGSSVAPMSAPNRLRMSASATTPTEAYAVMPYVSNLQNDSHRLKFKAYATSTGRTIDVGYFTSYSDYTSFVIFETFNLQGTTPDTATEFTCIPTNIPAGINNLVFRNKPASGTALVYVDDVVWEAIPNCLNPTDLSVSSVTDTSADLSWQAGGSEFEWQIEWGLEGFVQGTGNVLNNVFVNLETISGLSGNTNYSFYVRAVCDTNSFSPWQGPFTFTTACGSYTEYSTDFEPYATGTGLMPNCWLRVGNGTVNLTTGAVAPMSPTKRLIITSSATTPTVAIAALPKFTNLAANSHRLRFKGYATSSNRSVELGYLTDLSDASSFVILQTIALPGNTAATATEFVIYPGAIPAGIERLALRNQSLSATATMYLDDFVWEAIPSCVEPINLTSTNLTDTTITLAWGTISAETEWQIEYGTSGFALGSGTLITANTNPFEISGLLPNTLYDFYVKAICNVNEQSNYSFVYTTKTNCGLLATYNDNFEAYSTGTTVPLPDCWDRAGTGSFNLTTGSVAPMSPTKRFYMFSSATANPPTVPYLILPGFSNLSNGTHRLKLTAYATSANRTLDVGYFTNPTDINSFVLIESLQLPSTAAASAVQFTVVPQNIPSGVTRLVLRNQALSGTAAVYFDDVIWEAIPSCVEPSAMVANSIANNAVTLGWTANNAETEWEIEYGLSGFSLGSGTIISGVTTNPLLISGLLANTTYQVYVRAKCNTNEFSEWSNVFTFTTLCDAVSVYNDNFEAYPTGTTSIPPCWTGFGNGSFYLTTGSVKEI